MISYCNLVRYIVSHSVLTCQLTQNCNKNGTSLVLPRPASLAMSCPFTNDKPQMKQRNSVVQDNDFGVKASSFSVATTDRQCASISARASLLVNIPARDQILKMSSLLCSLAHTNVAQIWRGDIKFSGKVRPPYLSSQKNSKLTSGLVRSNCFEICE